MQNLLKYIFYNTLFLSCIGCAAQSKTPYIEDVGKYRPKYPSTPNEESNKFISKNWVTPKLDITKQLNSKMDTLTVRNKKLKYAQGYRILVYTGNSSEEVKKVKERLESSLSGKKVEIYDIYRQPTFRLKLGDYFTRLEASATLAAIQKDFPNAIVVPDQINLQRETRTE